MPALRRRTDTGEEYSATFLELFYDLVGVVGTAAPALVVGALLLAVLVGVAVADQIAGARRTATPRPAA